MAFKLSWLSTCKASQLKAIASATGINSSGTKPALTLRLLQELSESKFSLLKDEKSKAPKPYNIVSIDMGIRNLAYCRFTLPGSWKTARKVIVPTIHDWTRIAISQKTALTDGPVIAKVKEPFDPATYSQHAHDLITSFLSSRPTQVLIERQRFRSMGGSSVQEWTLRVNMFEAMLYAVLKTYSALGLWSGAVYPVVPKKVSKFWLGDAEGRNELGSGLKSAKTKTAKIELVGRWLEEANTRSFELKGKAAETGRAYLEKRKGRRKAAKDEEMKEAERMNSAPADVGKLDDLADCLLQGMAWIQWEQNRRMIVSEGLEAMEKLESY